MSARNLSNHIEQLRTEGYTVVEGVFDDEYTSNARRTLDRLGDEVASLEAGLGGDLRRRYDASNEDDFRKEFYGGTLRLRNLLIHGEVFQRPPIDPTVLEVVDSHLDPGYLLQVATALVRLAGEAAQVIHADDQFIPVAKPHVPYLVTTVVAITDFTESNGATRLLPGSHLRTEDVTTPGEVPSKADEAHYISATMPRGSVLFWHGSLLHGGGENRSQETRYGLGYNYCAGWIRPMDNLGLGLPLDLLATFSPRLQQLCGVRGRYMDMIGGVCDNDPAAALFGA